MEHSWIIRFLRWFCPPHLLEEIEGDLLQRYERDLRNFHERKAKLRLLWNVIRFFRPGILLRNKFSTPVNSFTMLRNYWKTTYRHILKSKINFTFKLGGLTLALFSFLVIALYVNYQLSFDRFHEDHENIYRVNSNRDEEGNVVQHAMVPSALGLALKDNFPQVKAFTRLGIAGKALVKYNDKLFHPNGFVEADSSVFDVFTFKFVRGNRKALGQPESIVLTESLAKQIFGSDDPINKSLLFTERSDKPLYVRAVVEDFPSNSHLDIRALLSFEALSDYAEIAGNPWDIDKSAILYVRLNEKKTFSDFTEQVQPLLIKHVPAQEDGSEKKLSVFLQPITSVYLGDTLKMEFCRKGDMLYVYIFSLLGLFILAIAVLNYVNLSIADFSSRTKEMGVRKIMGAKRKQIVIQIGWEALTYCLASLILSVSFLYVFLPHISARLESGLQFEQLLNSGNLVFMCVALFILWMFSALYPSLLLFVSTPVNSLKGLTKYSGNVSWGSKLLLTQFVISVLCICATLVMKQQIDFIKNTDVGYNRSKVVSLLMPDRYPEEKAPALKIAMQQLSGVESASFSYYMIAGSLYWKSWYKVEREGQMKQTLLNEIFVDPDFLSTMGIQLIAGRNFSNDNPADVKTAFLVNEAAVKQFGWENPIGKRIRYGYDDGEGSDAVIVGVTRNFNIRSLHEKIEPLVLRMQYDSWPGYWLNIKINGNTEETLAAIKSAYEKTLPGFVADCRLLEDVYNNQYKNEEKAYTALQVSTWVIMLISALGIFSLSVYLSTRRTKEFGIRKVLGASINQIVNMQLGYFLKIVLTANVIALPLAWWLMNVWLNKFAYHTNLSIIDFIPVLVVSALLVVISAGYASWRAGRMNPVDAIKTE